MSAGAELEQLYRSESSVEVKQRILQGLQNGNNADKLAAIAKSETDPQLRRSAIRYLGNMRGSAPTDTLTSLYASEQSEDVKKAIIRGAVERRPRGGAGGAGAQREEPGAEGRDRPPARQHAGPRGPAISAGAAESMIATRLALAAWALAVATP